MVYIQLFNSLGVKIDEVGIEADDDISKAIANVCTNVWCLEPGDTIKVVEE